MSEFFRAGSWANVIRNLLGKPIAVSLRSSLSIQTFSVVSGVVLARALGVEGRGVLAATILWPTLLATIGGLGIADGATYLVSRRQDDAAEVLGTTYTMGMLQSAILVGLGALLLPHVLGQHGEPVVRLARMYLLLIPLSLANMSALAVVNGLGCVRAYHGFRALVSAISTVGIVVLGATGRLAVWAVLGLYLFANSVVLIGTNLLLKRRLAVRPRISLRTGRALIVYGTKNLGSVWATSINERLDQLIISAILPASALGLYVVAVTLSAPLELVGTSVGLVLFPIVAGESKARTSKATIRRHLTATVMLSSAASLALIALAPRVITVGFGQGFSPAIAIGRLLLVAGIFLSLARALAYVLRGLGIPLRASMAEGIGVVVTGLGLAILLPRYGLWGAAIVSVAAYAATALFQFTTVRSHFADLE